MRKSIAVLLGSISLSITSLVFNPTELRANADAQPGMKDWTFLIYLNGNNNLDSFGEMNINQMEKIGSTSKLNVVVQWASLAKNKTQRLLVKKDSNANKVTSPIVQDMGSSVDMGDYRSLVEFVRWGVENYPAKHYFINVWDHGSGWHLNQRIAALRAQGITGTPALSPMGFHLNDISWDDNTGHFISTVQLGQAMAESAKIIGHKVDLYGSDACLMSMAEVAGEMASSVDTFVGSQEVEPGAGWPYDMFLKRWSTATQTAPADVAKYLVEEFVKSYQGGSNGNSSVTLSALDLNKMPALNAVIADFGAKLVKLGTGDRAKVVTAASGTQNFTYGDYGDLSDFVSELQKAKVEGLKADTFKDVQAAVNAVVVSNGTTPQFARAKGLSIWLPTSKETYDNYSDRYSHLVFQQETHWGEALRSLLQDSAPN